MGIEREKEWFLESTDTKDRFVADDEPTQRTFDDLLSSTTFKQNKTDKATTASQGLVKAALVSDVHNRASSDTDYTYATTPNNLPNVIAVDSDVSLVPEGIGISEDKSGSNSVFKVSLLSSFKTWLYDRLVPVSTGTIGQYLAKGSGITTTWETLPNYSVIPDGLPSDLVLGDHTLGDKYTTLGVEGGTTAQILAKSTDSTGDYGWTDLDTDIAGGTTGQILIKNSATDGDYSWGDESVANTYTLANDGVTNSLISAGSSGNDFKTKGVGVDVTSTSDKISLSSTGTDLNIKLNKPEGDDLLVVESSINWGDNGIPSLNTFYGWVQHIVDTGGVNIFNRIVVNQSNVATTLGGVIDSTKEYFIDGIIDLGSIRITVPPNGINLKGSSFDISGLTSNEDNYIMFESESIGIGSGSVLGMDYFITVSGANSKVYELYDATGFNAFEFQRINYNDCTSLGDLYDYRQGLESGTGRFGGSPSLTLHGLWRGGFRISTSIVRSLAGTMTEPLFKEGVLFQMNSRFLTDINIDLPTLAPFCDFKPINFPNPSTLQIHGAIFTRDGGIINDDSTVFTGISSSDLSSEFIGNNGVSNTHVGGNVSIITEAGTTINTIGVYETLQGTFLPLDLQHFDSPSNGQLRHLGNDPRDYEISANIVLEGTANVSSTLKFRKWDNSEGVFVELNYTAQTRVINNNQGGRDVAYFNLLTGTTLDQNDYIYLQIKNNDNTDNFTAELGSFFRVSKR